MVDIAPTICQYLRIPLPAQCEGAPLADVLTQETLITDRRAGSWTARTGKDGGRSMGRALVLGSDEEQSPDGRTDNRCAHRP
jgi:hypothetical protein